MKAVLSTRYRPVFAVGAAALIISLIASAAPAPGAGWQTRVSRELLNVYSAASTQAPAASQPSKSLLGQSQFGPRFDSKGRVQIRVDLDCAATTAATALKAAGLSISSSAKVPPFCVVEGWISPAALPIVASVTGVKIVRLPVYAPHRRPPPAGRVSAPTQSSAKPVPSDAQGTGPAIDGNGVTIMRADQYVAQTSVNGSGVTVGVMSDDDTSVSVIQARSELPTSIPNLTASGSANPSPTDEGTMMLEEVHAVAPGASLMFCGPQTDVEYLNCMSSLAAAGVSIVVDDLAWMSEDLMSSQNLVSAGVQSIQTQNPSLLVLTVTANQNGTYWQGAYNPVSLASLGYGNLTCAANGQVDAYVESFNGQYQQTLTVNASRTDLSLLEWADPWTQNASNFDVYVQDASTGVVTCNPGAGAPQAGMLLSPNALSPGSYGYLIATPDASLAGKFLKLLIAGDGATALSLPTTGSVVAPQAFAPGVVSVGAVLGSDGVGDTIEPYSGTGPITVIFGGSSPPQAPGIVAPDAIYVDAVGTDFQLSSDGYFHGTSAAAPNAAGVAALLRSAFPGLDPTQLATAIESGAAQLGGSAPNGTFGYGRVDALGALGTFPYPTMSGFPNMTIVGGSSSPAAPFTISGVGNLRFSVKSSNPSLIPASLVAAGSPGVTVAPATCGAPTTNCTISVTPAIGLTGTAQITLIDADGANRMASITSTMTVTAPPPPTVAVTAGGSQSLAAGASATPVSFAVAGTGTLTVSATSSNSALVSGATVSSGCGTNTMACTANLSLMPSHSGSATVTLNAKDAWGGVGQATAVVNVSAPPSSGGGGGGSVDALTLLVAGLMLLGRCVERSLAALRGRRLPLPLAAR